jgi:hypothetical protein
MRKMRLTASGGPYSLTPVRTGSVPGCPLDHPVYDILLAQLLVGLVAEAR